MEMLCSPTTQTLTLAALRHHSSWSSISASRRRFVRYGGVALRYRERRFGRHRLGTYLDDEKVLLSVAAAAAMSAAAYYLRGGGNVDDEEEERPGESSDEDKMLCYDNSSAMHEEELAVESLQVSSLSSLDEHAHEEPIPMSHAVSKLEVESCGEETEVHINYQRESTSALSTAHVFREANNNEMAHSVINERQLVTCNRYVGKSGNEEHHLFDNTNLSVIEHTQVSHGATIVSSPESLPVGHNFPGNATTIATHTLREEHLAAGFIDGLRPLGYKDGPSHSIKDLGRGIGTTSPCEGGLLFQEGPNGTIDLPHLLELHVNRKRNISEGMRLYNDALKYGRLKECIELLEEMDTEGVVDMKKVYHARFLGTCRHQKAVEEAFRFVKLIPNPTMSTFNLLMSVCASAQDLQGALQVKQLVRDAGYRVDCKLYTTLISTFAKSGKVDQMFEVFNEMVNSGVVPNLHTYGALIDGCAKAGQVAKAFGAYGILKSKNLKPDRVVFNALITACGQSGAVDRAFDVLAEMIDEPLSLTPDHVTVGALINSCVKAGQVVAHLVFQIDRVKEAYKLLHQYEIKGTPEVYTIALTSCSQNGDWEFACSIYDDIKKIGVVPDEMFFSALIDVAGHAGNLDAAFNVLKEARVQKRRLGITVYSSLMGACSNSKNWKKALDVYEEIKTKNLNPTVPTMNALITALCDGDQLHQALEALTDMKKFGLCPNSITYSVLFVASEKKNDLDFGLMLLTRAKSDRVPLNLVMSKCIIGMCERRHETAKTLGNTVVDVESGHPKINSKWTSIALTMYRDTIAAGVIPSLELLSQVLRCLKLPQDASLKQRLIEATGVDIVASTRTNMYSLIDGFVEYDPRAFLLLEESVSHGLIPSVSLKSSQVYIDATNLPRYTAEVYLLTVFKGLKHRLAAGAKLPNIIISLPVEKAQFVSAKGERTISIAPKISRSVGALLRRLGIDYIGYVSQGKIRIDGLTVKRWLQPTVIDSFGVKQNGLNTFHSRLAIVGFLNSNTMEDAILQPQLLSKEFIKPSRPTPETSRTLNLSLLDHFAPRVYV
ncbi:Pentatricopeptide repeat-containing protein [Drosera capensis]